MSYVRSRPRARARAPMALGTNKTVYQVVREAMDKTVNPWHPGMTVTPVHPGMTVTPIGLGSTMPLITRGKRPRELRPRRQGLGEVSATGRPYTRKVAGGVHGLGAAMPEWVILSPPPPTTPPSKLKTSSSRLASSRMGLGDNISDCIAAAPGKTASLDAMADDLNMNWHPTGYYAPNDVLQLISSVLQLTSGTRDAILTAQQSALVTQGDILQQQIDDLNSIGSRAIDYIDAAKQAIAQGADVAVDAAGLRRWVIDAINTASSAFQAAYIATCSTPDRLDMVAITVLSWGTAAYQAAKAVVGLAQTIVNKTVKVFDFLAWVVTYGPWIGVGVGAWWLYKTYGQGHHAHAI